MLFYFFPLNIVFPKANSNDQYTLSGHVLLGKKTSNLMMVL